MRHVSDHVNQNTLKLIKHSATINRLILSLLLTGLCLYESVLPHVNKITDTLQMIFQFCYRALQYIHEENDQSTSLLHVAL